MPKFRIPVPGKKAKTIARRINSKVGGRKGRTSVKCMSTPDLIKESENLKTPRDKNKVQKELAFRQSTSKKQEEITIQE